MNETTVSTIVAERIMTVDSDPRARPLPQTSLQLIGHTSGAVIEGLGRTPAILGVVILNLIGVGAAVFFLNLLISGQQQHLKTLVDTQQGQFKELIEIQQSQLKDFFTIHKHQFDTLVAMLPRSENIPPTAPTPTPTPTTPQSAAPARR
jgi:hypothetical protein